MNTTTIIGLLLIAAIAMLIVRGRRACAGMANYTSEQFEEKLKGSPKPMLVDVREQAEYGTGHLLGAVLRSKRNRQRRLSARRDFLMERKGRPITEKEVAIDELSLYCRV
ncbi:rhodanese-like domain-containing protein [Cohnella soli]|uniref:Rhodanese-like domain-containing protein n=1 Tax=Cohnella soli TaxID=425005 RepID=A0ABW0HP97_9BACL